MSNAPPLIKNMIFVVCKDNHVHIMMLGESDKEIGEFIVNDINEASSFSAMFAEYCLIAFNSTTEKRNLQ